MTSPMTFPKTVVIVPAETPEQTAEYAALDAARAAEEAAEDEAKTQAAEPTEIDRAAWRVDDYWQAARDRDAAKLAANIDKEPTMTDRQAKHATAKARWTELTAQIDALSDEMYQAWLSPEKPDEKRVADIQARAIPLSAARVSVEKEIYATDIDWTDYVAPGATDDEIED